MPLTDNEVTRVKKSLSKQFEAAAIGVARAKDGDGFAVAMRFQKKLSAKDKKAIFAAASKALGREIKKDEIDIRVTGPIRARAARKR